MDVVNAEQVRMPYAPTAHPSIIVINGCSPCRRNALFLHPKARIAEEAGACAVMALERVPADIRATGGVARMVSARLGYRAY
jgi:threonine dehydratase